MNYLKRRIVKKNINNDVKGFYIPCSDCDAQCADSCSGSCDSTCSGSCDSTCLGKATGGPQEM